MKHNTGISCTFNEYTVTAIAIKDGETLQTSFKMQERNKRAAAAIAAEAFGVKPARVIVDFKLEKRAFTIDCDYTALMNALGAADIPVTTEAA